MAAGLDDPDPVLRIGALEIRVADGLVTAGGHALNLSVREFELLVALARSGGGIVRRETLYGQVWGGAMRSGDRSIDVYVHKLRSKLETVLPAWQFIHTHVGFGYRFSPEPAAVNGGAAPASAELSSHAFHIVATDR